MDSTNGPSIDVSNLAYVEALHRRWRQDPEGVPTAWQRFFAGEAFNGAAAPAGPSWERAGLFRGTAGSSGGALQHAFDRLLHAYRVRGHRMAALDPLGRRQDTVPELDPAFHGIQAADLEEEVVVGHISERAGRKIGDLVAYLKETYCGTLGAQFMHIQSAEMRDWLVARLEGDHRQELDRERQRDVFRHLTEAVNFEAFVQRKFLGAKSFSLEGGESLIPLLDLSIDQAATLGTQSVVIGMGHRGRLNVLAHILGKDFWRIFREFQDPDDPDALVSGDVKYHLGYAGTHTTPDGAEVYTSLCFNPSHLSFVAPVVQGRVRAKQDRLADEARAQVLGIVVHGDAAFAGEGIIQETLNMSRLPGYEVGGMLHVIVNNQIGFTTQPDQGRSTMYASDVASMLQIPIFHVNGEDPEAVARAVRIALEYRALFRCDAVIDMYCYRRRGHNEGDEPRFTQPDLYAEIDRRKTVRDGFLDRLIARGSVTREEADEYSERSNARLEAEFERAQAGTDVPAVDTLGGIWSDYYGGPDAYQDEPETALPVDDLRALGTTLTTVPPDFHIMRKLERILDQRRKAVSGERDVDWATAEALAFASLAETGVRVRLTGQDCERGTFSQRHAVWHDEKTASPYSPFSAIEGGPVEIVNSPLSEMSVVGFEYGYSLDMPEAFVGWEAQFGDFVNCAQVIIDQFLVSAEDKWRRLSGLVLLLPHGFEGQGPEHSSARLERFLTLAAEDNIQIAQPTTAAQFFHLIRRQVLRRWRKPLIVMTPKSLLRKPEAGSPLTDLATGGWQRILPDPEPASKDATQVLLVTGKVAFDLLEKRTNPAKQAIVRLEQIYPLADHYLEEALARHPNATEVIWVQEEPSNMGAWPYIHHRFGDTMLGLPLRAVTRDESASPATGSGSTHRREQEELISQALGLTRDGGAS